MFSKQLSARTDLNKAPDKVTGYRLQATGYKILVCDQNKLSCWWLEEKPDQNLRHKSQNLNGRFPNTDLPLLRSIQSLYVLKLCSKLMKNWKLRI
jgi:hypothetical protein